MCEWSTKKIGEIADLILSNVDKHIEPSEKQVLLCNYMDVYNNRYIKNGHKFSYGSVKPDEFEKYRLKINDVIITKDSETPDDIAVPAMVFDEFDGLVCGYHLAILRPNVNLVSGSFLMHVLQLNEVSRFFSRAAKGATRYGITKDAIMNIEIFMPDLVTEQERIADILSNVDNTIEKTEDLIEKYQKIKVGMMQDLFTCGIGEDGKIRPPYHEAPELYKETELGMVPKEWEVKSLQSVVSFFDDKRVPIKQSDRDNMEGVYPYYGASGIIDWIDDYIFDDELILLAEDGENLLSRKLPIALKVKGKLWVNNHAHVIKPNKDMGLDYLTIYLQSLDYKRYIIGSAQPKLNQSSCKKILIKKPSKSEQDIISSKINYISDLMGAENKWLGKLKQLKQALMQDFLTGKVRVPA